MKNKGISQQIRSLKGKYLDSLSEKQIYTSSQMKKYLDTVATSMLGDKHGIRIHIHADGPDGLTGCTDGQEIHLNFQSSVCAMFSTPADRFKAFIGLLIHELSHVLFCDFTGSAKQMAIVESGNIPGNEPVLTSADDIAALEAVRTALSEPVFRPVFETVYSNLDNAVADQHDENKSIRMFNRFAREPLLKTREALRGNMRPVEEMEKDIASGEYSRLSAMFQLFLEYIRFGMVLTQKQKTFDTSELTQSLKKMARNIEIAVTTDDTVTRFTQLNYVVTALWPFIDEELKRLDPNQKQDPSGTGTGTGSQSDPGTSGTSGSDQSSDGNSGSPSAGQTPPTQEQIRQILDELAQAAEKAQSSTAPKNRGTNPAALNSQTIGVSVSDPSQGNTEGISGDESGDSSLDTAFTSVLTELACSMAASELENQQGQVLKSNAIKTINATSSHKGIPVTFDRPLAVTESDRQTYENDIKEVQLYSKRLQKKFLNLLKEERGGLKKHRPYGNIICAEDYYRPDGLYFANKKAKSNDLSFALAVLIDMSGSMSGRNILCARRAAVLLHDFATGIGIPVYIAGHSTGGADIVYTVFTDFDRYTDNDRYRLAKIRTYGCNRDGAAIEIAAAELAKRPEMYKLMIVISDGLPNHFNYGGQEAEKDIMSILTKYRRQKIEILGAAIDSDKDKIESIYGDGFLDITNLENLAGTMLRVVKKRVVKQVKG